MIDTAFLIFVLPTIIFSLYAQNLISRTYTKYSQVDSETGLTGADVANMILKKNGIFDVSVRQIPGVMTDHFDPRTKTVMLSDAVYNGTSIASVSIAAHEVGHAMQKNEEYFPLSIRSALVPAANFGTNASWFVITVGFALRVTNLIYLGIALFSAGVLFQFVTLPVEFNASRRATHELADGIMPEHNVPYTKKVLRAAAMTYVATAVAFLGQVLRMVMLAERRRR